MPGLPSSVLLTQNRPTKLSFSSADAPRLEGMTEHRAWSQKCRTTSGIPRVPRLSRFRTILMIDRADSATNRGHHVGWQRKGPAREPEFQGGPMNCQPSGSVIPAQGQVNSPTLSVCEETTILCFSVRERTAGMIARCHPLSVVSASSPDWRDGQ
jgi:hypothetical protein